MKDLNLDAYVIKQLLLTARDYCSDIEAQMLAVETQKDAEKRLNELNLLMFEVSRSIEKISTLIEVSIENAGHIQQN
ncbi:hypothetical protein HMPREF2811_02540 [Globicatella sp. HMSC072A10]|uniref:hypothetical protein n=1 Tax=Globicatella sp. HMSC072A10 TaxID=1739315 RepID=UPI0008B6759D|nr:hypothetical protein [Globicatella sp. HMSC072A10]OFK63712.1 hypothetical protein HMPREF2811_02540 [Globicatella sp. HMSC072A10]